MRTCTHGFTLLDLITTLAIISITVGITIPALGFLINSTRVTADTNEIVTALALARSEAINRNELVLICKSDNGSECNHSANWHDGWIIFSDTNHNHKRETEETLIRVHTHLKPGLTLEYRGFGSPNYTAFRPTGFTNNGSFVLCKKDDPGYARKIIINTTGRVRTQLQNTDQTLISCS